MTRSRTRPIINMRTLPLSCGHDTLATVASDSGRSTVSLCGPCLTAAMADSPVLVTDGGEHTGTVRHWWVTIATTATVMSAYHGAEQKV